MRENRTQGSARGASGNWRFYLNHTMIPEVPYKTVAQTIAAMSIGFGASCGNRSDEEVEISGVPEYVWRRPSPYVDQQTGVTYFVGCDGRHVTARASDGRLIWKRNPFKGAKLGAYRVSHPRINIIGEPKPSWILNTSGNYVGIGFDSSQFGIIDTETGDFRCLGND